MMPEHVKRPNPWMMMMTFYTSWPIRINLGYKNVHNNPPNGIDFRT
jgi:hypothetical protein